jgi:hypothetical protein
LRKQDRALTTRTIHPKAPIQRVANLLDNRSGFRLHGEWGHVSVLRGGGHICELGLKSVPGVNPLWRAPWETIDPDQYLPGKHRRLYGPPPDGSLLAGIAGHSVGFDHFGPPSMHETAAGLTTHGEAPSMRWKLLQQSATPRPKLQYGGTLRHAQIDFSRTIVVDRAHPVIYCEEEATNLSAYDRPIAWNEHVTFGPPFLESGTTIFDMPATRAQVCGSNVGDAMFVQADAEFTWPTAPTKNGKNADLRLTPDGTFGHYTTQLLDPKLDIAFVSACNPVQQMLVVYAFRRADFPWVGNWEEKKSRSHSPWNARTFCRGIEFSTTPYPVPRREMIDQSMLFGERTYRWLPAKSRQSVRYLILLFKTPETFAGVKEVAIEAGTASVTESGSRARQLTVSVGRFLDASRS